MRPNPVCIDKNRGKLGKDTTEIIQLLVDQRPAKINAKCFYGGKINQALVVAHNRPDLIAFCEAVRNLIEQVDCADHISKDGSPVLCGLINERCYKHDIY